MPQCAASIHRRADSNADSDAHVHADGHRHALNPAGTYHVSYGGQMGYRAAAWVTRVPGTCG